MAEFFHLIDLASGNVVGEFESEGEALEMLAKASLSHSRDAIAELSLVKIADGSQTLVALREELVRLVLASSPATKAAVSS